LHLTVRAADGAAPLGALGDRRGEKAELGSLAVVFGQTRPAADAIVSLVLL